MITRQQIVDIARSYLGAPWVHQGRDKDMGIDCAGLIVKVAHELGVFTFDTTDYARAPDGNKMRELCNAHLVRRHSVEIGSILLMQFVSAPQHLAIVTGEQTVIHSLVGQEVIEHTLSKQWLRRVEAVYDYPGVTDG